MPVIGVVPSLRASAITKNNRQWDHCLLNIHLWSFSNSPPSYLCPVYWHLDILTHASKIGESQFRYECCLAANLLMLLDSVFQINSTFRIYVGYIALSSTDAVNFSKEVIDVSQWWPLKFSFHHGCSQYFYSFSIPRLFAKALYYRPHTYERVRRQPVIDFVQRSCLHSASIFGIAFISTIPTEFQRLSIILPWLFNVVGFMVRQTNTHYLKYDDIHVA